MLLHPGTLGCAMTVLAVLALGCADDAGPGPATSLDTGTWSESSPTDDTDSPSQTDTETQPATHLEFGADPLERVLPGLTSYDVTGIAATDGAYIAVTARGELLIGSKEQWRVLFVPNASFTAVWAAAVDDIYAVGRLMDDDKGIVVHTDGKTYTKEVVDPYNPLVAVAGRGPGEVAALGHSGELYRLVDGKWQLVADGVNLDDEFYPCVVDHITDLWLGAKGEAAFALFATCADKVTPYVPTERIVFSLEAGSQWEVHSKLTANGARAFAGDSLLDLTFLTGSSLGHFNGAVRDWTVKLPAQNLTYLAEAKDGTWYAASPIGQVVVVKDKAVRVDEIDWRRQEVHALATLGDGAALIGGQWGALVELADGVSTDLNPWSQEVFTGVFGATADDIFAITESGKILRGTGTDFSVVEQLDGVTLNALWGRSSTELYAAGSSDSVAEPALLRFDGSAWSEVEIGALVWPFDRASAGTTGDERAMLVVQDGEAPTSFRLATLDASGWTELGGPLSFAPTSLYQSEAGWVAASADGLYEQGQTSWTIAPGTEGRRWIEVSGQPVWGPALAVADDGTVLQRAFDEDDIAFWQTWREALLGYTLHASWFWIDEDSQVAFVLALATRTADGVDTVLRLTADAVIELASPVSTAASFVAIDASWSEERVYVVGNEGDEGFVLSAELSADTLSLVDTGAAALPRLSGLDVVADDGMQLWLVGQGGFVRYLSNGKLRVPSGVPSDRDYTVIDLDGYGRGFILDSEGQALWCDSNACQDQPLGSRCDAILDLHGAADATDVYAACANGGVLRIASDSTVTSYKPSSLGLQAVWAFEDGRVLAGGLSTRAGYLFDGTAFSAFTANSLSTPWSGIHDMWRGNETFFHIVDTSGHGWSIDSKSHSWLESQDPPASFMFGGEGADFQHLGGYDGGTIVVGEHSLELLNGATTKHYPNVYGADTRAVLAFGPQNFYIAGATPKLVHVGSPLF